ncbi:hypothetical protein HanXRQr2_Chr01g0021401 [Helianthus annuus]|uniref:Uncharacterized protein n=1 Tax=Helianthus annuus TaxID=4232 RepID=A0A251VQN6_HELAN|nr:hypothetical protein HanXRQr2_Chr01g0021401 [Helianthus annuus]KAJ0956878.1 hypothetical protein HanPSC8_Chr01g0020701 [Helianthus annuus]
MAKNPKFGKGVKLKDNQVTKYESQIEANWTTLKAWKSGYKSYLNKEMFLFK